MSRYEARGKFKEHDRGARVPQGAAKGGGSKIQVTFHKSEYRSPR